MSTIAKLLIILLTPILLLMGSIRLLTTNAYLAFEYGKADFPADPYGFDRSQRLDFASTNLRFVRQKENLRVLMNQEYDNQPLYNERELSHMQDVQNVFQAAWLGWKVALGIVLLSALVLLWRSRSVRPLSTALMTGGLLTAGGIILLGVLAIVGWDSWFTTFHELFFVAGTWTFNYSDTLIRLFPQKFWFDGVLTVGGISLVGGLILAWIGGRLRLIAMQSAHPLAE